MKLEQYFQSYYCQKTQDIISKLPKKLADELAERFSTWQTDIEREKFMKGKRKYPLPCDVKRNEQTFGKKDYRIVSLLKKFNALTARQIGERLGEPSKAVTSKLYHAVKRGELIKLMPPPNSKIRYDVTMYALANNKENTHELQSQ